MSEKNPNSALDINEIVSGTDVTEMDGKYLSFWINEQLFAVEIADVVQIIGVQTVTDLPESPHYVKGLINLRGSIFPIIDVRLRLGKPERAYDERTCIIVTNIYGNFMGLVVDAVNEVTDIDGSQITPPPQINGEHASAYITGVATQQEGVVLLISTHKLLGEDKLAGLR